MIIISREIELPKLDILIVDIDGTFAYHQTVAVANRLFLKSLCRFFGCKYKERGAYSSYHTFRESLRIIFYNIFKLKYNISEFKNVVKLFWTGTLLYSFNFAKKIVNMFLSRKRLISSEWMIIRWANTVKSLNVLEKDYLMDEKIIKKELDMRITKLYNFIRNANPKMKAIGISQSFSINKKPVIKKLLGIKELISNKFIVKNGKIVDYEIIVPNGNAKKKYAEYFLKKNQKVGLFIDNYDDVQLLELKGIKFVVCKLRLRRFVKVGKVIIF